MIAPRTIRPESGGGGGTILLACFISGRRRVAVTQHRMTWLVHVLWSKIDIPRNVQKSGNKTSSGEIGLNIRTHASPKVGYDQVSAGVRKRPLFACRTR